MRTRQPKAECDIVTVTVTGDELLLQCKGVRCLRVISPRQRASSLCSLLRPAIICSNYSHCSGRIGLGSRWWAPRRTETDGEGGCDMHSWSARNLIGSSSQTTSVEVLLCVRAKLPSTSQVKLPSTFILKLDIEAWKVHDTAKNVTF
eukprot:1146078-Pelagomonas_calceolata.AAC.6